MRLNKPFNRPKRGVRVAQSQLASAQAQERQSQAALDQALINLEHTKITAPVDGTVIARRVDVGQTVAASFAAPTSSRSRKI